jgi:hypothetical protein
MFLQLCQELVDHRLDVMAHTRIPSYSEGSDQEDHGSRSAQAKY